MDTLKFSARVACQTCASHDETNDPTTMTTRRQTKGHAFLQTCGGCNCRIFGDAMGSRTYDSDVGQVERAKISLVAREIHDSVNLVEDFLIR